MDDIFNSKFIEIVEGDQDDQINFLKIYPIFKPKQNLITLWTNQYSISNNQNAMITFLTFGLEYDLIEYKMKDILTLLNILDNNFRDIIKSSIIKGKTNTCIKKISLIDDPHIYDKNTSINIKTLSPSDIAYELTRKFSFLIDKITYHELIFVAQHDNKYNKNDNELISPIELLISDFHKLSYIVYHTILVEDKSDIERMNTIKHILKICDELKVLGNYHAIFALVSALNNAIVQRLDSLWKTKKGVFIELSELINPCNNYRNYRAIIKKHTKNIIPYLAVIICDIKHILEYPLYEETDFNMEIYNLVLNLLNDFKRLPNNYSITKNNNIYKWFSNITITHTENEFYEISNTIKPSIHKQLLQKLAEEKGNIIEDEQIKIIPHIKLLTSSGGEKSYDSVEEIIKITNMQKKAKHKSMPPLSKTKDNYINWSTDDVINWLCSIGMDEYGATFKNEEIDGLALANLDNEYLRNDLNIMKLGHRIKILDAIKKI
jgi:hypothetical protein